MILGADVIYEAPLVPLVANLLAKLLAPRRSGVDRQPVPRGRRGVSDGSSAAWALMPSRAGERPDRRRPLDPGNDLPRHASRSKDDG